MSIHDILKKMLSVLLVVYLLLNSPKDAIKEGEGGRERGRRRDRDREREGEREEGEEEEEDKKEEEEEEKKEKKKEKKEKEKEKEKEKDKEKEKKEREEGEKGREGEGRGREEWRGEERNNELGSTLLPEVSTILLVMTRERKGLGVNAYIYAPFRLLMIMVF